MKGLGDQQGVDFQAVVILTYILCTILIIYRVDLFKVKIFRSCFEFATWSWWKACDFECENQPEAGWNNHRSVSFKFLSHDSDGVLCRDEYVFRILLHFWTWAVKLRYHKINVHLRDNFLTTVNKNWSNQNLNRIAILHNKLVDVSELVNRWYEKSVSDSTRLLFYLIAKWNFYAAHDYDRNWFRLCYSVHIQLN